MREAIATIATNHWRWVPLGELCNIKYGKLLATNRLSNSGYPVFGANGVIGYHTSYLYQDEEVLISCRGAYSGKINLSPPQAYITNNSLVLEFRKPSDVFKRFYYYALQIADKSTLVTGTAQPQVTINNAVNVKVPVVPVDEQKEIVAEIEKQFTRLEAGVAGLRRVQANLKRYRAAVLKAACEGKLVPTEAELARQEGRSYETGAQLLERILTERRQRWNGKGKYKEPTTPAATNLPSVPEGWTWAAIDQVALIGSGNTPAKITDALSAAGDVPWFKVGDMNHVENSRIMRIAENYLSNASVERLGLRIFPVGTIIFPKRGGAIATNKKRILETNATTDLNVMGLTPSTDASQYFWWWFSSLDLASFSDGSNVPQVNNKDILPIPVPLPPVAEQQRIVAEVERRLSVVQELEAVVNTNLKRGTRLRQSILQKAFDGSLLGVGLTVSEQ